MVTLWFIATQHCGLEAAGLLAQECEQTDGQHGCDTGEHSEDNCQLVENATYKTSNAAIKVLAPQLVACIFLRLINVVEPTVEQSLQISLTENTERPRNWVPTWCFVQRTALPPGAPSLA